jgi:hypothetical protein
MNVSHPALGQKPEAQPRRIAFRQKMECGGLTGVEATT